MEEAVAPIVEQVLQDPPVESEVPAAMTTEEPSTTAPAAAADPAAEAAPPAETPPATAIAAAPPAAADATEQPAPETAVEAADGDAAKPAATSTPAEAEGEAKPAATETAPAKEGEVPPPKKPKRKETRKRVRRVGKAEPRKFVKIDPSTTAAAAGEAAAVDAAARPDGAPMPTRRVLSKHDEKWNNMFDRLLEYKKANNHTLVPQCYHDDPRLGRWVHYQRVEYWIYQQSGTGKITPERIGRLEAIGFEWDPQKAQWNIMFDRLVKYKEEIGHCKVPKGYAKDTELANWVRNQRLEQANLKKGKKSRMTSERYDKLTALGFRWSTSIAKKGTGTSRKAASTTPAVEAPKEDPTTKAVEEAVAVAIEMDDSTTNVAAATTTPPVETGAPAGEIVTKGEPQESTVIQI